MKFQLARQMKSLRWLRGKSKKTAAETTDTKNKELLPEEIKTWPELRECGADRRHRQCTRAQYWALPDRRGDLRRPQGRDPRDAPPDG